MPKTVTSYDKERWGLKSCEADKHDESSVRHKPRLDSSAVERADVVRITSSAGR